MSIRFSRNILVAIINNSEQSRHLKSHIVSITKGFECLKLNVSSKRLFHLRQLFVKLKRPHLLWTVPFLTSTSKVEESGGLRSQLVVQKKDIRKAIQEADELFASDKYQEATSTLLPYKGTGDVEVMWRLSRAQYKLSQSSGVSETEKRQLIHDAYTTISEALTLDDAHWAVHKWMSVLLDARFQLDGIKARVAQLERVKNHMLKAVELNPKDATTFYMLGSWCYQMADMPWIQRKIAATIFTEPPTSSFEEALHFFTKAEEIQPKFYSQNLLMLGKTLLKLQRPVEATHYLGLARDYPSSCEEDDLVRKEATDILKNMKINENARK